MILTRNFIIRELSWLLTKNQFKKFLQDFVVDDKTVTLSRRESKATIKFCACSHSFSPCFLFPHCNFDSHALKPGISASFLFGVSKAQGCHHCLGCSSLDLADVQVSGLGFPGIWKSETIRAIAANQMFCQPPNVLWTSSFQEPIQLLLWKVTLNCFSGGWIASLSIKVVTSYLELTEHISCCKQ